MCLFKAYSYVKCWCSFEFRSVLNHRYSGPIDRMYLALIIDVSLHVPPFVHRWVI